MNLIAETAILTAVQNELMSQLDLPSSEVDIEIDDMVPSVAGDVYYAISPAGTQPGRDSSQQIDHDIVSVRVCVFQRITDVARDRRREVMTGSSLFRGRLASLNQRLADVTMVIRNNQCLVKKATESMIAQGCDAQFIKPLTPVSYDSKPSMVTGEVYAAKKTNNGGEMWVAMKRGITFGGAEVYGPATAIMTPQPATEVSE